MKVKFTMLFLVMFLLAGNVAFASFPVERTATTEQVTTDKVADEIVTSPAAVAYDKWVAVALWFFLGWPFAAHRWYAKKPVGWNILYIVTIGGLGIWAIVDLINILTDNFQ